MLEEILDYIHNYFIKEIYRGKFEIVSGSLSVDFLKEGQYFKIVGSDLNDGIYKYGSDTLIDEKFKGQVWAMSVPASFTKLVDDITDWQDEYGNVTQSPYQSESFGGYSYSKASSNNSNGKTTTVTWRDVFASRLNAYRKLS